jgi:hypothetical protein
MPFLFNAFFGNFSIPIFLLLIPLLIIAFILTLILISSSILIFFIILFLLLFTLFYLPVIITKPLWNNSNVGSCGGIGYDENSEYLGEYY